jgi:hydroxymethylpyrimidine/phosphomethylpyrimidine kinase
MRKTPPCILTIGGLDPSGGAGLPADARAVEAFGGHACGVATAVIAQNTIGVADVAPVSAAMLTAQLENLLADITPQAVKIGVLPHAAAVKVVARVLRQFVRDRHVPIIVDPVFAPSSGRVFADTSTITLIERQLLPLADFVTPNVPEAVQLSGLRIDDKDGMRAAAVTIRERCGVPHVLLKGGHLVVESEPGITRVKPPVKSQHPATPDDLISAGPTSEIVCDALDVLYDGTHVVELRAPFIAGYEVRGTGCHLAAALATLRAQGVPPLDAAWRAKTWLQGKIATAQPVGKGRRVIV